MMNPEKMTARMMKNKRTEGTRMATKGPAVTEKKIQVKLLKLIKKDRKIHTLNNFGF